MTDEQRLALKIVTGEVSAAQAARFAREAEIGARVHHRHVLPIVDVGIADGVPFLAMELAEHGSLEEQRARFGDATWALPLLAQIAEGLAALHALGVVHRDLKPANVLFTTAEDGATVAKISDFGISTFGAFVAAEVDPTAPTMSTPDVVRRGITATGALLGTPYYMAPEAIHGAQALTAAADAFAFGILACEMLTGRTPFPAPPFFLALTGEPIATPTVAFDPAIAPAVREAITACLAIEPAGRPALRSLAGLLAGDPTRRAA
ncbi:MAG: serine/threonine protein kinase [Sandaracinaceae bacterium]|nr:serine/threonine protein kinase [Sandaracinaceae bacterium]